MTMVRPLKEIVDLDKVEQIFNDTLAIFDEKKVNCMEASIIVTMLRDTANVMMVEANSTFQLSSILPNIEGVGVNINDGRNRSNRKNDLIR